MITSVQPVLKTVIVNPGSVSGPWHRVQEAHPTNITPEPDLGPKMTTAIIPVITVKMPGLNMNPVNVGAGVTTWVMGGVVLVCIGVLTMMAGAGTPGAMGAMRMSMASI